MTKILVFGAAGRMGGKIIELASADKNFKVTGALESRGHSAVGKKLNNGKLPISSDMSRYRGKAQAIIDFTIPTATLAHLEILSGWKKTAAVIGTTGFSEKELGWIKEFSKKIAIVLSPNMSRGVNLMLNLARTAAQKLSDYDIEILEVHHNKKKDAPSGTALALANEIADQLKRTKENYVYGRSGLTGARSHKEIGIHAIRGGDIVGEHTVLFASGGEKLELKHTAASRDAFASGALHAAKWVAHKKPGLYTMKDVLGT